MSRRKLVVGSAFVAMLLFTFLIGEQAAVAQRCVAGGASAASSSGGVSSSSAVPASTSSASFLPVSSSSPVSASSRVTSGPLTGYENFSTPFGSAGYESWVGQKNASFYRYPMIQKSANLDVRRANRQRSEDRLARRREMRRSKRTQEKPAYPPVSYVANNR